MTFKNIVFQNIHKQPVSENLRYSPVAKLVHGHGKVPRVAATTVQVVVVQRDQIHVVEDETVEVSRLLGLEEAEEAHVEESTPVENLRLSLQEQGENIREMCSTTR